MSHKTNKNKNAKNCWIITEGLTGTENQCLAVAEQLEQLMPLNTAVKRTGLRQPWKTFSPYIGFECAYSFTGDALSAPWPDIVIASGRKSIAAAMYIKKKTGGKCFTIQLQDPRIAAHNFDLVAVPAHDGLRGDNVIVTDTAPNLITTEKLKTAKTEYKKMFGSYSKDRKVISVLIGGNSKTHSLTPQIATQLCNDLKKLSDAGHSLLITTSRRTDIGMQAQLKTELKGDNVYIWTSEDESHTPNPYLGMLAYGDAVIVTEDSVSMVSDALQTSCPVYLYKLSGQSRKFDRFYKILGDADLISTFTPDINFKTPASHKTAPAARLIAEKAAQALL